MKRGGRNKKVGTTNVVKICEMQNFPFDQLNTTFAWS